MKGVYIPIHQEENKTKQNKTNHKTMKILHK